MPRPASPPGGIVPVGPTPFIRSVRDGAVHLGGAHRRDNKGTRAGFDFPVESGHGERTRRIGIFLDFSGEETNRSFHLIHSGHSAWRDQNVHNRRILPS